MNFKELVESVTFENLLSRGRTLYDYVKARYDLVRQEELDGHQKDPKDVLPMGLVDARDIGTGEIQSKANLGIASSIRTRRREFDNIQLLANPILPSNIKLTHQS